MFHLLLVLNEKLRLSLDQGKNWKSRYEEIEMALL